MIQTYPHIWDDRKYFLVNKYALRVHGHTFVSSINRSALTHSKPYMYKNGFSIGQEFADISGPSSMLPTNTVCLRSLDQLLHNRLNVNI
mgnify:CR=1 FL=1